MVHNFRGHTFVLSVDQIQRVIQHANKLILPARMPCGLSGSGNARTIGKRTRVLLCTGHAQRFAGVLVYRRGYVRHTEALKMRSPSDFAWTGWYCAAVPCRMTRDGAWVRFAPELWDYLFCCRQCTYKFQVFRRFSSCADVIISRHGRCGKNKK